MSHKIHLRGNAETSPVAKAACALKSIGNGKVNFNGRQTYATMGAKIIGYKDAAAQNIPEADICAHCAAEVLAKRNIARKAKGMEPINNWREKL